MKRRVRRGDTYLFQRAITHVTRFNTAVDVGAHSGEWCALLSPLFLKIHAFEPNSGLFGHLTRYTESNVFVHNVAISNYDGTGTLTCPNEQQNKLRSHYVVPEPEGAVRVRTIDSYNFRRCDFLKIDVEGNDLLVLQGASDTIDRCKPVIVVECKIRTAARFGWTPWDLAKYMHDKNYSLVTEQYPNRLYKRNRRL